MPGSSTKDRRGVTLIELMAVVLISGIAITGLVIAYTDGISYWRSAQSQSILYSEGSQVLLLLEKYVRQATFMETGYYSGHENAFMNLKILHRSSLRKLQEKVVQFYFNPPDNSIRMNDFTNDQARFHQRILPIMSAGHRRDERPYLSVKSVSFRTVDPQRPDNPTQDGYGLVRIDLVLEGALGDTLALSSIVAKRNAPLH